jgi:SAM-dependent methyltransferase
MTGMSLSKLVERTRKRLPDPVKRQIKNIAYRARLKLLTSGSNLAQEPHVLFRGIGDGFWFWLNTEGCRISPTLRNILPTMPEEDVQLEFNGLKGDDVMSEGFAVYRLFRNLYDHHVGPIARCGNILDFGCGWGRIIRFFLKDIEPSRLLGVDPVEEMVALCKEQNRWCGFERIPNVPPSHLKANTFEWIYSFSVFSHLSEEMHKKLLAELSRLLKPGGLLVVTTCGREFIEAAAAMRKRADLRSLHPGPRSCADAFPETQQALLRYDRGDYCFAPVVHGLWTYWGWAAISKNYVLKNWGYGLTLVDYINDRNLCSQNVVVMKKGTS